MTDASPLLSIPNLKQANLGGLNLPKEQREKLRERLRDRLYE